MNKLTIITLLILTSGMLSAQNLSLITPYGTFTTCEEAVHFRDNKLFKLLEEAFPGANESEKLARYNQTLDDFQTHKVVAVTALEKVREVT